MVTSVLLPVFGDVTKNRHIQSCFLQSDYLPSHKMGRKTITNKCDGFSGMLQLHKSPFFRWFQRDITLKWDMKILVKVDG